ncbi:hypothetical protein AAVH_19328 [Aphelenchoides avenae]|nr:hypothetical protein AAVH_19328 [Aphelenchus avenae]
MATSSNRAMKKAPEAFPEAPDSNSCCGSGCQNCVWIQYAQDVVDYFKKHPEVAGSRDDRIRLVSERLKKHVENVTVRTYLLMEVKAMIP